MASALSWCRDLQQLYNQLVMAGVLTEDEFWKGRQGTLKQRLQGGSAMKQLRGYQNAMVSEQALSGGGSTVTVLSDPLMQQACACCTAAISLHHAPHAAGHPEDDA